MTRITPDHVLSGYVLRDPRDGIIESVQYMEKIIAEFTGFAEKVKACHSPVGN
ncbi:hypothetical protein [Mucilaginibacter sp. UR6-11]|uniref:hypothetical protein n=1 Tax=Mucilaginibacter sp. UR6-11 TaxID=1435644 RepID=UPI001E4931B7|nr:hypothetical protein [Mucilaginibacter sp. UR6-11]MCC8426953.1 hypothetical protein [Mucilaginibacter sp. UR6-11]